MAILASNTVLLAHIEEKHLKNFGSKDLIKCPHPKYNSGCMGPPEALKIMINIEKPYNNGVVLTE